MRRAPRSPHGTTAIASSPWIVVAIGVVVMVVLLIIALGAYRGRGTVDAPPEPAPPLALPEVPPSSAGRPAPASAAPVRPGLSPRSTVLPATAAATSASAGPPSPGGGGASAPPAAPAAPASVTGRYRVVETFSGGFIAEVLVRNESGGDRGWTARLGFPGGRVVTAWVEGAPQGTLSAADGGFTYRSGVDLAPGVSAPLRFHIERADPRPASCTVDGGVCRGL